MRTAGTSGRVALALTVLIALVGFGSAVSGAPPTRQPGPSGPVGGPSPSAGTGACAIRSGSYEMPASPDASRKYLFYLHGLIVEEQGRNASNQAHGAFCYDDVVHALADRGFVVISEVRRANTEIPRYAQRVVGQIRRLLEAGVPPENITVAGFSKGGRIAISASAGLDQPKVNFVIMAG